MLGRALFTAEGRVRASRMVPTVIGLIAFALVGGLLVAFAPAAADTPAVFLALVSIGIATKLPLIAFIAWLVLRNREWPSRPPNWSRAEVHQIIEYIRAEATRATSHPNAAERLAYLRDEAWHVADRAADVDTPDAVALALELQALIEGERPATASAD